MPGTRCCQIARATRGRAGCGPRRRSASRCPSGSPAAIVLARLANLVDGHAGARPALALAVAAMLDGGPLPAVPARGNGGSGEILALGHLFGELADGLDLEPREKMALINGSPCAAALVADAALGGRARLALAERTFALSVEAIRAPLDGFAPELGELWGDEHEAARARLTGHAAGGRCARAPGASGSGEPSRPAARARPRPRGARARRAHRGRLACRARLAGAARRGPGTASGARAV